jgi:hypothetical protein
VLAFCATIPVAARMGNSVPWRVLSSSASSFAVTILATSWRLAIRLWNPSMKTMSSFSLSSRETILFRSFSSLSVFFMMSISWGEMATTTLEPA